MNSASGKTKPASCRLWLWLGLFVALLVSYPVWRVFIQYLFDPKMPGGLAYTYQERRTRIAFDAELWKAFPRSTNEWPHTTLRPIRIRMVDGLLKQHDFKGQSRDDVEKLLGPKTKTEYFSDWDLVYYLGPGRYGAAIGDSEWLVLRFDATGRVQDYRIVHD